MNKTLLACLSYLQFGRGLEMKYSYKGRVSLFPKVQEANKSGIYQHNTSLFLLAPFIQKGTLPQAKDSALKSIPFEDSLRVVSVRLLN